MSTLAISFLCAAQLAQPTVEIETGESLQYPTVKPTSLSLCGAAPKAPPHAPVSFGTLASEEFQPFGTAGSWRWHVGAGGALDVKTSRNRLLQSGIGASYFVVDNLSLDAELNVIYFSQVGDDAVGANLNISFRHHLLATDTWSLYGDAGAGILGTTEPVPADGSRFNFVPHAGVGMSFDVGRNMRLMTGVRWHHISNANTFRRNPGRDSVQGYVSLSLPF